MLASYEKTLILRLITFVNWKTISIARKVERHFENIPPLVGRVTSYKDDVSQPQGEQAALKAVLTKIAEGHLGEPIREVDQQLRKHVQTQIILTPKGDVAVAMGISGVTAITWYAVSLIIDGSRGLRERLSRCGAPGCERFIIEFGSRGRPKRHCNEDHRRKADALKSVDRSKERRDTKNAEEFFREGKSIDFVLGRYPKLSEEKVKQIAKRIGIH